MSKPLRLASSEEEHRSDISFVSHDGDLDFVRRTIPVIRQMVPVTVRITANTRKMMGVRMTESNKPIQELQCERTPKIVSENIKGNGEDRLCYECHIFLFQEAMNAFRDEINLW